MRMYFIALVLPDELNKEVRSLKDYMREKHGCKAALRSPAHITIVPPFWMDETLEEKLTEKLDEAALQMQPFTIQHDGYSSFPPKTIFISSKPNRLLDELHEKVNAFFKTRAEFPIKFDNRPFHPHVTIATRDLTKRSYHEAWIYFKEKKFLKDWECSSISLLGLSEDGWQILHTSAVGEQ